MEELDEEFSKEKTSWKCLVLGLFLMAFGLLTLGHALFYQFHSDDALAILSIVEAMAGYLLLAGGVVCCDNARP